MKLCLRSTKRRLPAAELDNSHLQPSPTPVLTGATLSSTMSLPTRKIADTQVTAIGWGAMGLSIAYGPLRSDDERMEFLDDLYASGCHFWDTADVYGDNEDLLGKWYVVLW